MAGVDPHDGGMGTRVVHVVTGDRLLRRALLAHLGQEPLFELPPENGSADEALPEEVIVSTTTDCPSNVCQELTERGLKVVVLAALPKPEEGERYASAGARAYIPMTADGISLVQKIREAVS